MHYRIVWFTIKCINHEMIYKSNLLSLSLSDTSELTPVLCKTCIKNMIVKKMNPILNLT